MGPAARARLGLLAIGLAVLAPAMDTSVNIAMPSITRAFALGQRDIQWVVTCYMLAYGALMLTCGKVGDLYGHRRVLRLGLALCACAFIVCALSTVYPALLAGRALQGIGIALSVSCAPALATALYSEGHRTWVLGVYGALFALGTALGPLLGSWLVQAWGWSGVFAFRVPVSLAALALSWSLPANLPGAQRVARAGLSFDWLGAALLVAWMSALMLAFAGPHDIAAHWPGKPPWLPDGSELGLTLGCVGFVLFVLFVVHETRCGEPIIRPGLFRSERFAILNGLSLIASMVTFAVMLIVPYFLVNGARMPIRQAGLVLAMSGVGNMVGSWATGVLARSIPAPRLAFCGLALAGLGLVSIGFWSPGDPWPYFVASLLLQGVGVGLFQVAYNDSVIAALPIEDRGVAGSLTMMVRTLGIIGGATGLSALLQYLIGAFSTAGQDAASAFASGFQTTFFIAGSVLVAVLLASLVRPRVWR